MFTQQRYILYTCTEKMLNQADFEISHVWNFKVLANKKFTNAAFESAICVSSQIENYQPKQIQMYRIHKNMGQNY